MNEEKDFKDFNYENPPRPFWIASTTTTDYPKLDKDIEVYVAIVGGGMVEITTAYLLKKERLKVAVIEAEHIVQATTGHTTAKITSQHGLVYSKLINLYGKRKSTTICTSK